MVLDLPERSHVAEGRVSFLLPGEDEASRTIVARPGSVL